MRAGKPHLFEGLRVGWIGRLYFPQRWHKLRPMLMHGQRVVGEVDSLAQRDVMELPVEPLCQPKAAVKARNSEGADGVPHPDEVNVGLVGMGGTEGDRFLPFGEGVLSVITLQCDGCSLLTFVSALENARITD
jgi:hypothetical protein